MEQLNRFMRKTSFLFIYISFILVKSDLTDGLIVNPALVESLVIQCTILFSRGHLKVFYIIFYQCPSNQLNSNIKLE